MLSVQTTISFFSITIMQLILSDRKEKIFGITYQNILFKWDVLKYFNAMDCMFYMLSLLGMNIILAVMSTIVENSCVASACIASFIIALGESFIFAMRMIYLGMCVRFKKSRIYYLIYKKMQRGNHVYNKILKALKKRNFSFNMEYIYKEIKLLNYMISKINKVDAKVMDEEFARKMLQYTLKEAECIRKRKKAAKTDPKIV